MTYGLLGEKLGHSFSPQIHRDLGNPDYTLIELPRENVTEFFRNRAFSAINVTIPYKKDALAACDRVSPRAAAIGSVNTVVKQADGSIWGYNTDAYGFEYMLKKGRIDPRGEKCLVLGSGGSSVMAQYVLRQLGAREVIVISRSGENHYGNLYLHADAGVIVNTTPMGMYPNNGVAAVSLSDFPALKGVADIIYNPALTRLLLDAERLNIPHVGGLSMLVAQAKLAHLLFFGKTDSDEIAANFPDADIDAITDAIRRETMNILLIGMPSCGKSTVGRILAERTHRPLIDTDALIVERAGRPIPDIFASEGEETFRALETAVAVDVCKGSGQIIATGGGIVTRARNHDLLRQNSLVIFINRPLEELVTDGRPLSQQTRLSDLLDARLPLYRKLCDREIAFRSSPQVADEILTIIEEKSNTSEEI
ncbi:MAG: shikimate kinase [Eubacteriales bacterium]